MVNNLQKVLSGLACVGAGVLTLLAMPPYDQWWLSLLGVAIFAFVLHQQLTKCSVFLHALLFGAGFFGVGVSWVHVSIYSFGEASLFLSILLTSLFVLVIAILFAFPFFCLCIIA